jgi:hypothetical protein
MTPEDAQYAHAEKDRQRAIENAIRFSDGQKSKGVAMVPMPSQGKSPEMQALERSQEQAEILGWMPGTLSFNGGGGHGYSNPDQAAGVNLLQNVLGGYGHAEDRAAGERMNASRLAAQQAMNRAQLGSRERMAVGDRQSREAIGRLPYEQQTADQKAQLELEELLSGRNSQQRTLSDLLNVDPNNPIAMTDEYRNAVRGNLGSLMGLNSGEGGMSTVDPREQTRRTLLEDQYGQVGRDAVSQSEPDATAIEKQSIANKAEAKRLADDLWNDKITTAEAIRMARKSDSNSAKGAASAEAHFKKYFEEIWKAKQRRDALIKQVGDNPFLARPLL